MPVPRHGLEGLGFDWGIDAVEFGEFAKKALDRVSWVRVDDGNSLLGERQELGKVDVGLAEMGSKLGIGGGQVVEERGAELVVAAAVEQKITARKVVLETKVVDCGARVIVQIAGNNAGNGAGIPGLVVTIREEPDGGLGNGELRELR